MKPKKKCIVFFLFLLLFYSVTAVALAGKNVWEEHLNEDYLPNIPVVLTDKANEPVINAKSAVLIDAETGSVLWQKNGFCLLPPASTTKILTALLVLDMDITAEETTVSHLAASVGESTANLQAGEVFTVENLLKGALVKSANDTCFALAEALFGSEPLFVRLMTVKAESVGAYDAVLANTNGLPAENHYLSAYDLAVIARENLRHKLFKELVGSEYIKMEGGSYTRSFKNTNKLLWQNPYVIGIKTGTTDKAGKCLVSAMNKNGRTVIAVVLNSPDRFGESQRLLNYGIENFHNSKYISKGERLGYYPLKGSGKGTFCIAENTGIVSLSNGTDNNSEITACYYWRKNKADIKKGEVLGTLVLKQGERELQYINLRAETSVKTEFLFAIWNNLQSRIKRIFI